MIKWISKPHGACPVQAEGYFMGHYFYFRSRWQTTSIEFAKTEQDWQSERIVVYYELAKFKTLQTQPRNHRSIWKRIEQGQLH